MSEGYYPIENLADILAKFRQELELALQPIRDRLTVIEAQISGVTTGEPAITGEEVTVKWTGQYAEGFGPEDVTSVRDIYIATLAARRALYGVTMLLDEMGLPKDAKQAIRHIEDLTSAAIRLFQTYNILSSMLAESGFWFELGPIGWVLGLGSLAGAIAYGSRAMGG